MSKAYGIVYFSGTGNTGCLAERLGQLLEAEVRNIEKPCAWDTFFSESERVIVMYPVYFSVPPKFMRDFLAQQAENLANKEVISIVSQMIFSGDGARVVEDYLPETAKVIDTHHVGMPNNIPNIPFVPIASDAGNRRKTGRALRKIARIAEKLKLGAFKRRHCSAFSRYLGEVQRKGGLKSEDSKMSKVWVSDACVRCGLCARICPADNFVMDGKAVPQGKCRLCTRCENRCPAKAITVLIERPIPRQYPGPKA